MSLRKKILSVLFSLVFTFCLSSNSLVVFADEVSFPAPNVESYCNVASQPVVCWTPVKSAQKYVLYRSNKENGGYKKIKELKSCSYTDKDKKVKTGIIYYYKVKAFKQTWDGKDVESEYSAPTGVKCLKTVLVGDSIINEVKQYKVDKGINYISKIGVGPNTFFGYTYKEFSIKGKPAKGIDKVISEKPDRVLIMLGCNEIDWNDNAKVIENYEKVLNKLKEKLPDSEIIVLCTTATTKNVEKGNPVMKKVNAYNKEQVKLCQKLDLEYFDLNYVFLNNGGCMNTEYDGGDGCHWNATGCRVFVNQLNKCLKYCR